MALTAPAVPATTVAQLNTTGDLIDVTVSGGTVQGILSTPPVVPVVATPAVPATTVTAPNNNAFPVAVTIAANGATISAVTVNGSATGFTGACTVVVPAGGTVSISYTVATPTWVWTALFAGAAGNPVTNPTTVPCPPGGSVSLIYSAAPTWAWTNPPDWDEILYAAENTSQNNELAWPWYATHGEAGVTGLGEGVSN